MNIWPSSDTSLLVKVPKVLALLFLPVLGLVLALLVVEAVFRAAANGGKPAGWNDRPSLFYMPEGSKGMADRAYAVPKPAGRIRIAVVGDSFSFGPRLQFDDTYAKRLERMLNLNENAAAVEVINYAAPGSATVHELPVVRRALAEGADLVILQITLNDPEVHPLRMTRNLPYILGPLEIPPSRQWLFARWKSLRFVWERIHNSITVKEHIRYYRDLYSKKEKWDPFSAALAEIVKAAKESSAPLVAVVFPLFDLPIDEYYPFSEIHDQIDRRLDEFGIPVLDLKSAYARIPVERLQVVPGVDPHPNEIGHRIAAEKIYQFIKRRSRGIPPEVFAKEVFRRRRNSAEGIIHRVGLAG